MLLSRKKYDFTIKAFPALCFLYLSTTIVVHSWLMTDISLRMISRQIMTLKHDKNMNSEMISRKDCSEGVTIEDDLCLKVLDAALRKMSAIQTNYVFDSSIKDMVEVKESTIAGAGLGLFAKEKIEAGTLVAFYPVHVIGINLEEKVRRVSLDTCDANQEHIILENYDMSSNEYVQYVPGNRRLMGADIQKDLHGQSIFLDVDLSQPNAPTWASHRINDGAVVMSNSEKGVMDYYQASQKAKNCVNVPFGPSPILATVCTKYIGKGEELFTTYGCSYWLDSLLKHTPEVEEIDMTLSIIQEAKKVAMDILNWMKSTALSYRVQAIQLDSFFISDENHRPE